MAGWKNTTGFFPFLAPVPILHKWFRTFLGELFTLVRLCRGKIPMTDIWKMLVLLLHIFVGGAMLFNHLKNKEVVWIGTRLPIFLKAVFDVSLGIREGLLDLRFLHNLPGKGNIITSVDLPEATTSSVFKKFVEDEFLHAIQF